VKIPTELRLSGRNYEEVDLESLTDRTAVASEIEQRYRITERAADATLSEGTCHSTRP
jgi:hypothetical protein